MRKIYYVPKGQDIEKYRDIWENHTSEVHNSISENIKETKDASENSNGSSESTFSLASNRPERVSDQAKNVPHFFSPKQSQKDPIEVVEKGYKPL